MHCWGFLNYMGCVADRDSPGSSRQFENSGQYGNSRQYALIRATFCFYDVRRYKDIDFGQANRAGASASAALFCPGTTESRLGPDLHSLLACRVMCSCA